MRPIILVRPLSAKFHAGYATAEPKPFDGAPTLCGRYGRVPALPHALDVVTCKTCKRVLTEIGELKTTAPADKARSVYAQLKGF